MSWYELLWVYSFVVVRLLRHVLLFVTPWTAVHQATLSFTISLSVLKLMSIESMDHLNLCCLQPAIFPSIRVFSNDPALCIR